MTEEIPSELKIDGWIALIRAQQVLLLNVEQELKQAGMPPFDWYDILLELKRAPEGKLRLNEIGARVLREKSNITRLVDRLEREGLLAREECDTDRRGAYAVITEKGRQMQKDMWPAYRAAIQKHFASKMTEEEAGTFLTITRRFYS